MAERQLPKLNVAGSIPVSRSRFSEDSYDSHGADLWLAWIGVMHKSSSETEKARLSPGLSLSEQDFYFALAV